MKVFPIILLSLLTALLLSSTSQEPDEQKPLLELRSNVHGHLGMTSTIFKVWIDSNFTNPRINYSEYSDGDETIYDFSHNEIIHFVTNLQSIHFNLLSLPSQDELEKISGGYNVDCSHDTNYNLIIGKEKIIIKRCSLSSNIYKRSPEIQEIKRVIWTIEDFVKKNKTAANKK